MQGPGIERFKRAKREVRAELPEELKGIPIDIFLSSTFARGVREREILVTEAALELTLPAMRGLLAHELGHFYLDAHPEQMGAREEKEAAADRIGAMFSSPDDVEAFRSETAELRRSLR